MLVCTPLPFTPVAVMTIAHCVRIQSLAVIYHPPRLRWNTLVQPLPHVPSPRRLASAWSWMLAVHMTHSLATSIAHSREHKTLDSITSCSKADSSSSSQVSSLLDKDKPTARNNVADDPNMTVVHLVLRPSLWVLLVTATTTQSFFRLSNRTSLFHAISSTRSWRWPSRGVSGHNFVGFSWVSFGGGQMTS
jgi:hypothetical protein